MVSGLKDLFLIREAHQLPFLFKHVLSCGSFFFCQLPGQPGSRSWKKVKDVMGQFVGVSPPFRCDIEYPLPRLHSRLMHMFWCKMWGIGTAGRYWGVVVYSMTISVKFQGPYSPRNILGGWPPKRSGPLIRRPKKN